MYEVGAIVRIAVHKERRNVRFWKKNGDPWLCMIFNSGRKQLLISIFLAHWLIYAQIKYLNKYEFYL